MKNKPSQRVYRDARVKWEEKTEKALYDLVYKEQDYQRKKKHPAKWYRDQVAQILSLLDEKNPAIRSYEDKLKGIKEQLRKKNPLDKPWNVGTCMDNGISGEVIPILIRLKMKMGNMLTIRRARWLNILYPALKPMVEAQFPNNIAEQDKRYAIIPREYAAREKFYKAVGRDMDTTDLDTLFFHYCDISEETLGLVITDNIFISQTPIPFSEFSEQDMSELTSKVGPLTKKEIELLEGYTKAYAISGIQGQIYKWEHPEEMSALIGKIQSLKTGGGKESN
jgi:hypothetical protein